MIEKSFTKKLSSEYDHGFTLIELVVTLAIMGLIIPVIMGLVIQISRLNLKWQKTIAIKNDSFQVLAIIKDNIKNEAVSIDDNFCVDTTDGLTPIPTYSPLIKYLDKTGSENIFEISSTGELTVLKNSVKNLLHSKQTKFSGDEGSGGFSCQVATDDFFNKKIKVINVALNASAKTTNVELLVPTIHIQSSIRLRDH